MPDVGPDGVCAIAIASAAQSFGTTPDAVLSADRHRAVTDARAVAMSAARRSGLTLKAIADAFGKDHTSVMYAQTKVANNPRLNAVCSRVVDRLHTRFVEPISVPGAKGETTAAGGRSTTLQLAALDPGAQGHQLPSPRRPRQAGRCRGYTCEVGKGMSRC
ncbi:helix-turn-helix domain-containing protein [Nocardioides sp. B-3]|uniref:helix-turn-helix domain-containing protein n=1 Tax=Nocardioides sp. B-3 TaxID=2895565 RepID=UPI002153576E|nr:helix-turn-helix domain-containing protein [Nocardioides sp. B-3]UUZ59549.1 hypothetical protein LP418_27945 [Nocardioides sp. B-3]